MAPRRKEWPPELIAEGRRRYELTDETVASIARAFGIGRTRMNFWIGVWGWSRRRYVTPPDSAPPPPPEPPEPPVPAEEPPSSPPLRDPVEVEIRLRRVVDHELRAIDQVLDVLHLKNPAEAERSARVLAALARSLREVSCIKERDEPADEHAVPRDLDELRRDVGRRLDRLVAEATDLFADAGD